MLFTCITVMYGDNSTTPTDNTALLNKKKQTNKQGLTDRNSVGSSAVNTVRKMTPHTEGT